MFMCVVNLKAVNKLDLTWKQSFLIIEMILSPGNTKGGSITVPLTSCLTGLESAACQLTFFVFI
jgi:hypothetical protein